MLLLSLLACRVELGPPGRAARADRPTVWVYTSAYQEQVDQFAAAVAEELPDVDVKWFQGGSEKVAQRWEAEHGAGGSPACVLATSDPIWYVGLAGRGLLAEYVSPRALDLPRAWVSRHWAAHRVDLMVIGAPLDGDAPTSFAALAEPAWRGRFSSGDPFSSGTAFTTVAAWESMYGPDFLGRLDANGWVMAGGNSAVLGRVESGEKPFGVVLLNNLLTRAGVVRTIFPADGAVPIPGLLGITAECPEPDAAERVVDWLMGDTAQALVVKNRMHSPFPGMPAPEGAPPLEDIPLAKLPDDFYARAAAGASDLRARLEALQR